MTGYTIAPDKSSITCHTCGKTSQHPRDVEYKYCSHCKRFHEDALAWASIDDVVDFIKPLLVGRPPEMQGAILANLLALFLAGTAPPLREDILKMHIEAVKLLIPVCEQELFGGQGFPKHLT
jgi:hypothetical protein